MSRVRVTSTEVAARAGVSRSAVSRVFTPGASASKKTADKVRKAAEELGYRPNVLARAMVSGRSRIIGLVVAYLDNQFYPDALERLSNALQEKGYHVLIFMTSRTQGDVNQIIEEILDYQVDAIIAASVSLSSELSDRCRQAGVPVVFFNRRQDDPDASSVTSDNISGGRQVAEYLVASGRRKIGYIAGWEGASTQRDREAGFCMGLAAAGMSVFSRTVGEFHAERARDAARKMFDRADRPDAVFVANDHMAFAVMDVIRYELGLNIPADVAVVGYDDVSIASWPSYDLTTVRQHAGQMVAQTVEIVLDQVEGRNIAPRQIMIDGRLQARGSAPKPNDWPE